MADNILDAVRKRDLKWFEEFIAKAAEKGGHTAWALEQQLKNPGPAALHSAADSGQADFVAMLLSAGVDPNTRDHEGFAPLHKAAKHGHVETVKILLAAKADANSASEFGYTPLIKACSCFDDDEAAETVELLLSAGADVNAATKRDNTALHGAAGRGLARTLGILLAAKADVNAVTDDKETALMKAAEREEDSEETIGLLLAAGARIDAEDKRGDSALLTALERGNVEGARLLLSELLGAGAPVGVLALSAATWADEPDVLDLLFLRGGNPHSVTGKGETVLDRGGDFSDEVISVWHAHGVNFKGAPIPKERLAGIAARKQAQTLDDLLPPAGGGKGSGPGPGL